MVKRVEDLLEVVRQQNECTSMLQIQGHEYIVLGLSWLFEYIIHIYNIRIHEADVIVPFFGILAPSSYMIQNKRGDERA
jgi:hypothetical protein